MKEGYIEKSINLRKKERKENSPKSPGDYMPCGFYKRVYYEDLSEKSLQKNIDTERSYGPSKKII